MIEKEDLDKVLPNIDNIDDGVKLYREYYYKTKNYLYINHLTIFSFRKI